METAHEEKFFILFCSESNGSIHFDILCHADNHVVRTLGSMPPECMSYWPLQLPKQDDFVDMDGLGWDESSAPCNEIASIFSLCQPFCLIL